MKHQCQNTSAVFLARTQILYLKCYFWSLCLQPVNLHICVKQNGTAFQPSAIHYNGSQRRLVKGIHGVNSVMCLLLKPTVKHLTDYVRAFEFYSINLFKTKDSFALFYLHYLLLNYLLINRNETDEILKLYRRLSPPSLFGTYVWDGIFSHQPELTKTSFLK